MFLGLTPGEWFVVIFITLAVVSAPQWPRAGAAVGLLLAGCGRGSRKLNAPVEDSTRHR